jgi:predicted nucleic acid-binding protein
MKFWDSSALTPLLVTEDNSLLRESQLKEDPVVVVWYGTLAEIESALCRRKREGNISREDEVKARVRLSVLVQSWIEVQPTAAVRERALRLLRTHPLRAAGAFQLAASLVVCQERTRGFVFLTGDRRLRDAAEAEGFAVNAS